MLRVALRPRYLALLALMVVATVVCGFLANWQWDRAQRAIQSRSDDVGTVQELDDVVAVGDPVTNQKLGAEVRAHGRYDRDQQVIIPHRHIDGQDAAIVVTALEVRQADGSTAVLPVARGWLPQKDITAADGEVDPSAAPAAPSGEITVTGRLEASEAAADGVTAENVVGEIATPLLVNLWGGPMYSGYVAVRSGEDGLHGLPVSSSAFSQGLNWQNIGYALQWILFGGFFLYLWWRTVRAEYLDIQAARREALQAQLEGGSGDDGGPTAAEAPAPGSGTAEDETEPVVSRPTGSSGTDAGPATSTPTHDAGRQADTPDPDVGPAADAHDPGVGSAADAPDHQEDADAGTPPTR